MNYFIYGLIDKNTKELRYIGQATQSLQKRLNQHLYTNQLTYKTHKNSWIKSINKSNDDILDIRTKYINGISMYNISIQYYGSSFTIRRLVWDLVKARINSSNLPTEDIFNKYKGGQSIAQLARDYNYSTTSIIKIVGK